MSSATAAQSPLFSDDWYRVKSLKPRLADDVIAERHDYRGQLWWVLHRPSTRSVHRVDQATYELLSILDGQTRVEAMWQRSLQAHGEDAASQGEVITLLSQLYEAQLLTTDRKLSAEQMFARREETERRERKERFLNPLFMRFSMFDPEGWLCRTRDIWAPFTGMAAVVAWLVLLAGTAFVIAPVFPALTHELAGFDVFAPHNALVFFVAYPLLKLIHELAHAAMVKKAGGEVHELGIALMVLLPIPYVDASAAAACPDKRTRIMVSLAGIMVELAAAAVAALLWVATQPGLVHDVALTVAIIGSVSSLLFNGNPLLKFDAYYALADYLEIPNLAERGNKLWLSWCKRRLFGLQIDPPPFTDGLERFWCAAYAVVSTIYRISLMIAISIMLSGSYYFFGVLLALWVAFTVVIKPLVQFVKFVATNGGLAHLRMFAVTSTALATLVLVVGLVPWPNRIITQGVVWLPDNAIVRSANQCEVTEVMVANQSNVAVGQELLTCSNPELEMKATVLRAQLDGLEAERAGLSMSDPVTEQMINHKISALEVQLTHVNERIKAGRVVSAHAGQFVQASDTELTGQHFAQGDIAAYIIPQQGRTIRVAISEDDARALTGVGHEARIRLIGHEGLTFNSQVTRQSPSALLTVPSIALTTNGGGPHLADPAGDGLTLLQPVVDLELRWPDSIPASQIGSHVSVVVDAPAQTLAARIQDSVTRTFLGRINS